MELYVMIKEECIQNYCNSTFLQFAVIAVCSFYAVLASETANCKAAKGE